MSYHTEMKIIIIDKLHKEMEFIGKFVRHRYLNNVYTFERCCTQQY